MKLRRKARVAVLQALYEVDVANHSPGDALDSRLAEQQLPPAVDAFARRLLAGVLAHRHQLNVLIARHAPEWPLDQMAVVDRNILRIAIYELSDAEADTPAKVAINEAVEMAKVFGSDSSPRFVNGVLGALLAETPQPALGDDLPPEDYGGLTPAAAPAEAVAA
jgi:transcription antitermination protein NusB